MANLFLQKKSSGNIKKGNIMGRPIGIDLGTTYSAISRWLDAGLNIGPDCYNCPQDNHNFMASKVYISDLKNRLNVIFGANAIRFGVIQPEKFYSAFKRGMDDNASIVRPSGEITPVELSSMLLRYMLEKVASPVEGPDFIPEGVVVSVPYYFTEPPCQNTRTALSCSLEELYKDHPEYEKSINLRTVAEPVAAGLDYAFTNSFNIGTTTCGKENILIFDLGGGTFDITIYEVHNAINELKLEFTVLATDGDARLGGEDFDASIRKFILEKNGVDDATANDPKHKKSLAELFRQVTDAKCRLSYCESDSIVMTPFFDQDMLEFPLTSKNIDEVMKGEKGLKVDYLSKIDDIITCCVKNSELLPKQIDRVVLVGGSSKIPCIRKLLETKFGKGKIYESDKPSETVARGASIWAAYLLDQAHKDDANYKRHLEKWDKIIIKEKTAHNLGVVTARGSVDNFIASNKFTPVQSTRSYFPSNLNEDGTKAELEPLIIKQGRDIIGSIPFPTIYTHGRDCRSINISITLIAESTSVKVLISVPEGNEDGSDIRTEGQIQIA